MCSDVCLLTGSHTPTSWEVLNYLIVVIRSLLETTLRANFFDIVSKEQVKRLHVRSKYVFPFNTHRRKMPTSGAHSLGKSSFPGRELHPDQGAGTGQRLKTWALGVRLLVCESRLAMF